MGFVREKEKSTLGEKPKRDSLSSLSSISYIFEAHSQFYQAKIKL